MNNEINDENNTKTKKITKKNTLAIILIIAFILLILCVSIYFINNSKNKNKTENNQDITTVNSTESETLSSSSSQATSTPGEILENINVLNAVKSDTYKKVINNKEHSFTFYYYFEETKIEDENQNKKDGYNYILSIFEDDTFLSRYIIGFGLTKEEAENKKDYSNNRPNYDINMLTTIKDRSNNNEYLVCLIPSCFNGLGDNRPGIFITTPVVRKDDGSFIKKIQTTYGVMGKSFIADSKYGFSHESVYKNNGSYRIDDNKIYYTDISECNKNLMNLSIFEMVNGKISISNIYDLEIDGAGQGC